MASASETTTPLKWNRTDGAWAAATTDAQVAVGFPPFALRF